MDDDLPPIQMADLGIILPQPLPLAEYLTVNGIGSLIIAPFVTGMFYGLGEGLAYLGLSCFFQGIPLRKLYEKPVTNSL